jgi:HEAT repeat protein
MNENRTSRVWGVIVLLIMAAAVGLAFAGLHPYLKEPRYEGKRLSEWLRDLDSQSVEIREQTREALRDMGATILPALEKMIYAPDSNWRQKLSEFSGQQPEINLRIVPVFQQRWQAVRALPVVGPEAVDLLVKALHHEDRLVRMGAALGLGELQARPEISIPALMRSLQDHRSGIAVYAAEALASFGEQAGAAVPVLVEAIEQTDAHVKARIALALKKIDPEAISLPSSL